RHTRCYRDWSSDVCSSYLYAAAPPSLELADSDFSDARVHDSVQAIELRLIREDDRAEFCAVDAAGWMDDRIAKFLDDFTVGGLRSEERRVGKDCGLEWGEE